MTETQTLEYWLSTSAVEFSGTQTVTTPLHGSKAKPIYVASASLIVRADHVQGSVPLQITEGDLGETKFTLKFSDDGRLTSSDVGTTGAGAQILGSVASIAGELVALSSGVAKVMSLAQQASAPGGSDQPSATKTVTKTFDYILDVSTLPTTQELHAGLAEEVHPAAHRVWEDLGIMVTLDESTQTDPPRVGHGEGDDAPYQDGSNTRIWFRRPRRATLTVWSADEHQQPQLVRRSDVDVLDKHCRHVSLPLKLGHVFRKEDFALTMGTFGTPTAIGADVTSGVAAALGAIAGAPKLVSDGISGIGGVGTAWQKLNPSSDDKEIAALQATHTKLQLLSEIAKLQPES